MNTREINPISKWTKTGYKDATQIRLYNFHDYNFDGQNTAKVHYNLENVEVLQDGNIVTNILYSGTETIPNDLVQSWGADDEPIFDYVASQLHDVTFV